MEKKSPKDQIIDEIIQAQRAQLEIAWTKAQRNTKKEKGEDINDFISDLYAQIHGFGQQALKQYLEQRDQEAFEQVKKKDSKIFIHKKSSKKKVSTLFGQVEISRHIYQQSRGGKAYIPLDEEWGVHGHFASPDIRKICLYGSALMTPGELTGMLERSSMIRISESAIRNLLDNHQQYMEKEGDVIMEQMLEEDSFSEKTEVMVASMDGATVLMKAQENKTDDTSKASNYHVAMAGVLSCYKINYDSSSETLQRVSERVDARYFAQMPEPGANAFKSNFERHCYEAQQNLGEQLDYILLMDGASWQWKYVNENEQFENYHKLLDYFHATEHLSKLSDALFENNNDEKKRWFNKWKEKLKNDDNAAHAILQSVLYYRNQTKFTEKRIKKIEEQVTYFKNNASLMNYAQFRRRGWPIGSGPVEAACKTLIKQRMCCSGMRWTEKGGQIILTIRSLVKSGKWDDFWDRTQKAA